MDNLEQVKVSTGIEGFLQNAFFDDDRFKYNQIVPGLVNVNILSKNDSVVFNGLIDAEKGKPYTFLIYSNDSRVQGTILSDTISDYSKYNSYFRIVNVGGNTSFVTIKVTDQFTIPTTLSYRQYSSFYTTYPSSYRITVHDAMNNDSLLLDYGQKVTFSAGKAYTLIVRGDLKVAAGTGKLNIFIVESDFLLTKKD